jgi:hypothetical protein
MKLQPKIKYSYNETITPQEVSDFYVDAQKREDMDFTTSSIREIILSVDALRSPCMTFSEEPKYAKVFRLIDFGETEADATINAFKHRQKENSLVFLLLTEYLSHLPREIVFIVTRYYYSLSPILFCEMDISYANYYVTHRFRQSLNELLSQVKYILYPSIESVKLWNKKWNVSGANPNAIQPEKYANQMKLIHESVESISQHSNVKKIAVLNPLDGDDL